MRNELTTSKINLYVTEHFKYTDCVCPCCDRVKLIPEFYEHMEKLELLRCKFGYPIIINSGYRCPVHNREISGAKRSWHMRKFATDIRPNWDGGKEYTERLAEMYAQALELNFGGLGKYSTFIHLDMRPVKTRWTI